MSRTKIVLAAALCASGLLNGAARADAAVRKVVGVVVDEQGRPVAGAIVRTVYGDQTTVTEADGAFTLALPAAFRFQDENLVAEADGGARLGVAHYEEPYDSRPPDPLRIVLKPSRATVVHVKNAEGAPVAGAAVEALNDERSFRTDARTGPDGAATLRIPDGVSILWIMGLKSGAGFDYFENYPAWPVTDLKPLPPEVTLTLDGAQTVRVKAIDPAGAPVPGVVFLTDSLAKLGKMHSARTGFGRIVNVTTNAEGVAVFDWLPKDRGARFLVRPGAYCCPDVNLARIDSLAYRPPGPPEVTARMVRNTRLSGVARFPDGRPAPRMLIEVGGFVGYGLPLTRTDDHGAYALNLPPDQVYAVGLIDETWAAPTHQNIILRASQPRDGLDFALTKGTLVRGRVTEGPDHKPVAGSNVVLDGPREPLPKEFRQPYRESLALRHYTKTDAAGRYQFRVTPGQYTFQGPGQPGNERVDITVGEAEVVHDLQLKKPLIRTDLTGVVVEKTATGERPMARARVNLLLVGIRAGSNRGTTDDQGRFRIPRSAGALIAYAHTYGGALAGYAPVAEDAQEVKIFVVPAGSITGRVVDTNGKPQANRSVGFRLDTGRDEATSGHWASLSMVTDEQGRFKHLGIPVGSEGELSVAQSAHPRPGGARTVVPFQIQEPELVTVPDLVVPPPEPK